MDMCAITKIFRDPLGVATFICQVKLGPDRARELRHNFIWPKPPDFGAFCHCDIDQPIQKPQIGLDLRTDAGAADLENHLVAIFNLRAVNLRDRPRPQGNRIDFGEIIAQRTAALGLDFLQQCHEGHRGHTVAQLL